MKRFFVYMIILLFALVSNARATGHSRTAQTFLPALNINQVVHSWGCGIRPPNGHSCDMKGSTDLEITVVGKPDCLLATDFTTTIVQDKSDQSQTLTVTQDSDSFEKCVAPMQRQTQVRLNVPGYIRGKTLTVANPVLVLEFARP